MKKITAIVPDTANLDLTSLIQNAVEFKIEQVQDGNGRSPITRHVMPGRSLEGTVLEHFTPRGIFTRDDAKNWLSNSGYAKTSVGPAMSRLMREGNIQKLPNGKYQFLKGESKTETKAA